MLFFEEPRFDLSSVAPGDDPADEDPYEKRIALARELEGVELKNPNKEAGDPGHLYELKEEFRKRTREIADKYPDRRKEIELPEFSTPGEVFRSSTDTEDLTHSFIGKGLSIERAYDAQIETIKRLTGKELPNPVSQAGDPGHYYELKEEFKRQSEELAEQNPELRSRIVPLSSIDRDAGRIRAKGERHAEEVWETSEKDAGAWIARMGGGFYSFLHDPVQMASSAAIGFKAAGAGVKGLLWMGLKQGAANAGAEAAMQPFVQQWRKEANMDYGLGRAATDIGVAGAFGFGLDVGVRSGFRGLRLLAGKPYLGPDAPPSPKPGGEGPQPSGAQLPGLPEGRAAPETAPAPAPVYRGADPLPPMEALEQAARNAPEGSVLRRASEGDEDALRELAKELGPDADPAIRRALDELELEKLFPTPLHVDDGAHLESLARAIREESGAPELPVGDAIIAPVRREVARLADEVEGIAARLEDKPVAFRSIDPATVTTDASTFQFKSGGDVSGVTDRLRGVTRWDPVSAGKAIVFERADGSMVIADGHQRLGLAKRVAASGQDAKLDAYVFREADGWTPEDVRAYAALKNMRESSGTSVDMAQVMRDRPDLIDGSLPLTDAKLRDAAMLARLSPEAFDAVVAGRLPPPFAALIGESVADSARHRGLLDEMAAADLANTQQARLYLKQLMELPTTTETQMTLFGEESFTRTVLVERAQVLDSALRTLKADKRIFGLLRDQARAIEGAGNVLARDANQAKAESAAQLAELIEKLATSRGTVATILNDAAASVARGLDPKLASRAFVDRIADTLEREGLPGLVKVDEAPKPELAPVRMDDPLGPEAKAQVEDINWALELDDEIMFAIRAFHGTPHDFERFDLGKIGTGEGAQVFGHGLYFAESEGVARYYLDALSTSEGTLNGIPVGWGGKNVRKTSSDDLTNMVANELYGRSFADLRDAAYKVADGADMSRFDRMPKEIQEYQIADAARDVVGVSVDKGVSLAQAADEVLSFGIRAEMGPQVRSAIAGLSLDMGPKKGAFYEVDIDVDPHQLLDHDAKLADQPEMLAKVAPLLKQVGSDVTPESLRTQPGSWVYSELQVYLGSADAASKTLREAGIPGIRYLDQGSRATSGGELLEIGKDQKGFRAKIRVTGRGGTGFTTPTDSITTSMPFPTEAAARAWADEQINSGTRNIVIFDDSLIKITHKNGKAVSAEERQAAVDAMFGLRGFYSPAIRAAESISMKKGTGEQFLKQITKVPGVRKDELEWMGLEEFLAGKPSVTRDEVLSFMRAHQVELDEKVLEGKKSDKALIGGSITPEQFRQQTGASESAFPDAQIQFIESFSASGSTFYVVKRVDGPEYQILSKELEKIGQTTRRSEAEHIGAGWAKSKDVSPRFGDWKVPGGENYRELLIRLPSLERGGNPYAGEENMAGGVVPDAPAYVSKHFQDQEIVHLRVDDRTGPNGEKVLFINEVQSDLHQAGRQSGYRKGLSGDEQRALMQRIADLEAKHGEKGFLARPLEERKAIADELNAAYDLRDAEIDGVPNAPFKGDLWLELALKRALLYASENGYDAISWARSDQIAKAVGAEPEKLALQYDQKIGRFLRDYTKKWGAKVEEARIVEGEGGDLNALLANIRDGISGKQNPILRITPEMRASVMEGQPLAVKGGQVQATPPRNATLHNTTLSTRAADEMASIRAEIDKAVAKSLPAGWRAEVRQRLVFGDLSERIQKRNPGVPPSLEIEGTFDPYEKIIYVSMAAFDPVERAFEEAGHALKSMRLIPEADYGILQAKAKEIGARAKFRIDERYGDVYGARWKDNPARLEEALEEEAIMQMVAARARGDNFGRQSNVILDKLIKFLRSIRDMLGIKGFRSFEDVFEDMTEGGFARQMEAQRGGAGAGRPIGGEVMAGGPGKTADAAAGGSITQTPAFRKWFGGSKVVDTEGKPLVVYHGTDKDFETFEQRSSYSADVGYYFTPDTEYASGYATAFRDGAAPIPGAQVKPVYLSLKNPKYVLTKPSGKNGFDQIAKQAVIDEGHDGLIVGVTDYEIEMGYRSIKDANEIVAFDSTQIKSAIGNRGTFDPTDPRISFSFAGEKAATADKGALARAKDMAKAGASRDDIWRETGWFQGVDKKWRFEIDDSKAFYRGSKAAGGSYADEVFLHQQLYEAYPTLRGIRISEAGELSEPGSGSWSRAENRIVAFGGDKGSLTSHEMQHAIQDVEGFARGSNPDNPRWKSEYDAIRGNVLEASAVVDVHGLVIRNKMSFDDAVDQVAELSKINKERLWRRAKEYDPDEAWERFRDLSRQMQRADPMDRYHHTAGEVEARNVQRRMTMTPEERRSTPPWMTQDVADEEQIVRSPVASDDAFIARAEAASEIMLSVPDSGKAKSPDAGGEAKPAAERQAEGQAASTPAKATAAPSLPGGRESKRIRNLINQAAAEGKLPREDADALIQRYDALEQFHKDGGKAKQQIAKELTAEAEHRKRQKDIGELRRRAIVTMMTGFRDARGQADPAKAMQALIENLGQHELPQGFTDVAGHQRAIYGMALADLDGMLHEFRKTLITGQTRNKAKLSDVVRELHGEKTGDELAAGFAQASAKVMEDLRLRFNAAGGNIAKRKDWSMPQSHDKVALLKAGKQTWVEFVQPLLDLKWMKHPLTGDDMPPAEVSKMLGDVWDNLVSDGWHEREASMAFRGLSAIANTRADPRSLIFANADAWMKYSDRFGSGDDALAIIVSHIRGMTKDIAAMEVLGPNPKAMLTYMGQFVEQQAKLRRAGMPAHFPTVTEVTGRAFRAGGGIFARDPVTGYAQSMVARAENMWNVYSGASSAPVNATLAAASQTVKNINVATKLGGATVSALSDPFWQVAARKFAGLPTTKIIRDVVKQIGSAGEREARRAGVIAETYLHLHNEGAREGAALSATKISAYVADRVLSLSMLNAVTRYGNHAMSMGIQGHLADMAGKSFADLDPRLQRMFRRWGLEATDWDAIRLDTGGRARDVDFLSPADIRRQLVDNGGDPSIAERYLAMTLGEAQYATLTGSIRGQAIVYGSLRAGTAQRELWSMFMQFKSFAVNLAILQLERIAREFVSQGFWRGAQYATYALTAATLGGALIEQLQQLRNGKDPRDMTTPEFWGSAAYRSGGLSIWGDLLYASENRFGGGVASTIAGPSASSLNDILNLTYGSAKKAVLFTDNKERTNFGREATNFLKRYTPGASLWYVRTAWERVLMDNLQRMVDPEADASFRRKVQNARKDYKQEFWWKPGGGPIPQRGPRLQAAFPSQ